MEKEILDIAANPIPYPRTPEYSAWYRGVNEDLQYVFQTTRPVFTVTCSGSGVMQMAADNLCAPGDTVLTFATGTFGRRWGEIARALGADVIETLMETGSNVTPEILLPLLERHADAKIIFLTYNETSTTALADVEGCAELTRGTDRILVVDAVSALVAERLPMDDWGVDVVITSSQKALALPPGLGFIAFSEKAWQRVLRLPCRSHYFAASAFDKEWQRNQVPFTPSLSVILQLQARLASFRAQGLPDIRARYAELTRFFRDGLQTLGCTFPSRRMGNCTSAVRAPDDIDATELVTAMRTEQSIVFVPPYPGSDVFRVGNFGDITREDITFCLEKLAETMQSLRARKEGRG
jgi:aspartate aminotransferase-like enzyme